MKSAMTIPTKDFHILKKEPQNHAPCDHCSHSLKFCDEVVSFVTLVEKESCTNLTSVRPYHQLCQYPTAVYSRTDQNQRHEF